MAVFNPVQRILEIQGKSFIEHEAKALRNLQQHPQEYSGALHALSEDVFNSLKNEAGAIKIKLGYNKGVFNKNPKVYLRITAANNEKLDRVYLDKATADHQGEAEHKVTQGLYAQIDKAKQIYQDTLNNGWPRRSSTLRRHSSQQQRVVQNHQPVPTPAIPTPVRPALNREHIFNGGLAYDKAIEHAMRQSKAVDINGHLSYEDAVEAAKQESKELAQKVAKKTQHAADKAEVQRLLTLLKKPLSELTYAEQKELALANSRADVDPSYKKLLESAKLANAAQQQADYLAEAQRLSLLGVEESQPVQTQPMANSAAWTAAKYGAGALAVGAAAHYGLQATTGVGLHEVVPAVVSRVGGFLPSIGSLVPSFLSRSAPAAMAAVPEAVANVTSNAIPEVASTVASNATSNATSTVASILPQATSKLSDYIPAVFSRTSPATLAGAANTTIPEVASKVASNATSNATSTVSSFIPYASSKVSEFIPSVWSHPSSATLANVTNGTIPEVASNAAFGVSGLESYGAPFISKGSDWMPSLYSRVGGLLPSIGSLVPSFLSRSASAAMAQVPKAAAGASNSTIPEVVSDVASNVTSNATSAVSSILPQATSKWSDYIPSVFSRTSPATLANVTHSTVPEMASSVASNVTSNVTAPITGFLPYATSAVTKVANFLPHGSATKAAEFVTPWFSRTPAANLAEVTSTPV